jgi:hypothetical protein
LVVTATVGEGLMRLRRWASKDIGFPLKSFNPERARGLFSRERVLPAMHPVPGIEAGSGSDA